VDCIARLESRSQRDNATQLTFRLPSEYARLLVEKGSVAIDGISLTVNKLEKSRFYVNIIPHTAANTTLVMKKEADLVNIETDILGKYVEKLLQSNKGIDKDFLVQHGFWDSKG
jgi:riboflavin synthase